MNAAEPSAAPTPQQLKKPSPLRRMTGRDGHEKHRAATPLEPLMDLSFVVAFGIAGEQFAHLIAEGHIAVGMAGFAFVMFGIGRAWINSPGSPRPSTPTTGCTG